MSSTQRILPRVLVVDDDPYLARTLASSIKNALPPGSIVNMAHSLDEASKLISQEKFHAIVTDHELPDGKGSDFLRRICGSPKYRGVACFLVSGMDPDEIEVARLLKENPQITFFEKPFKFSTVAEKVRDMILPQTDPESSFYGLRLFELIQAYSLSRRSMTIRMLMPDHKMGVVALNNGDLIHAALGGIEGQDALLQMARNRVGEIRVEDGCATAKRTIHKPTQQTLIDTFRILDESNSNQKALSEHDTRHDDLNRMIDEAFQ